jgi:hypothetical protein
LSFGYFPPDRSDGAASEHEYELRGDKLKLELQRKLKLELQQLNIADAAAGSQIER